MTVFYILIVFLALMLVIVAMLPFVYNTEQAVIIRKALVEVRDTVANLNLYPLWSSLNLPEIDKSEIEIDGHPKMAGHSCRWKSKKAGSGIITIRAIDDRHIHFDLDIISWKLKTKDNWFFEEWGERETKVTLQNNGRFTSPFARFFGQMLLKKFNRRIRTGLTNLKNLCEKDGRA